MIDGRAVLVTGMTGSGKTAWTIREVRARRGDWLVWDAAGEWSRRGLVRSVGSVQDLQALIVSNMKRARSGPLRVGYCGPLRDERLPINHPAQPFSIFCRLAWVWARFRPGATVTVEELADVSTPGKAPAAWGEMIRKGRHVSLALYAITQRPAESDKTIVSNAAAIHCGQMAFPRDRAYMAKCLGVPVRDIEGLRPLDWIERDMRTLELRRGRVRF